MSEVQPAEPTSDTPTADLQRHAGLRGVPLSRQGAQGLLRRMSPARARERLDAIAALCDLASCFDHDLSADSARHQLDAVSGDYDAARDRLVADIEQQRQADFDRAWDEAERDLRARDAHERHAAFLVDQDSGTLGHRATLLLLAAAEAGVTKPSAATRRATLWGLCDIEFARRHQIDDDARTRAEVLAGITDVVPADPIERADWETQHRRYLEHTGPAAEAERSARELAEQQLRNDDHERDLALTINCLADHTAFRGDVERFLARTSGDLADARARDGAGGWHPDPERFRAQVVERAAEAARSAGAAPQRATAPVL